MSRRPYPWHESTWATLHARRERLPHALLLAGYAGIGKQQFAEALAAALLCERPQPDGYACGACQACQWFEQGHHPDYREILPPAESADEGDNKRSGLWIGVEQIRELADFVQLSSHRQGLRVILLRPADRLNAFAANALLKTLEEPPPGLQFLLLSSDWQRLLPTIRSRCQRIDLPPPTTEQAEQYCREQTHPVSAELLALAGGMPLLAAQYQAEGWQDRWRSTAEWLAAPRTDPLVVAADWAKGPVAMLHDWLVKWLYDLLSLSAAGRIRYYPEWSDRLTLLAERADRFEVLALLRQVLADRTVLTHPLNPKLLVEPWLIGYRRLWQNRAAQKKEAHG